MRRSDDGESKCGIVIKTSKDSIYDLLEKQKNTQTYSKIYSFYK